MSARRSGTIVVAILAFCLTAAFKWYEHAISVPVSMRETLGVSTNQPPLPRVAAVVPDVEMGVKSSVARASPIISAAAPKDTLKATAKLFGDSTLFSRITSMLEVGSNLVITDSRTSPHVFVFNGKNARFVKSMGRQGQGPGEILYPDNIVPDEKDRNRVWIYDFTQRRFIGLDITGSTKTNNSLTLSLPEGGSLLQPMIRRGTIISNGLFHDYSLIFVDNTGKPKGKSDLKAPFGPPDVTSRVARRLLNVSTMAYAPTSRDKVVLAYQFKSELDILDLNTGLHTAVTGPRPTKASFSFNKAGNFEWNADNQQAYLSVTADDNRIYALFSGRKDNDKVERVSILHVFDWNGAFLREYAFDRAIGTIAVSSSGTTIYGSVEEPWTAVAEYLLGYFKQAAGVYAHDLKNAFLWR